jgi:hypothetical protein
MAVTLVPVDEIPQVRRPGAGRKSDAVGTITEMAKRPNQWFDLGSFKQTTAQSRRKALLKVDVSGGTVETVSRNPERGSKWHVYARFVPDSKSRKRAVVAGDLIAIGD